LKRRSGFGYTPAPKPRAKEVAARAGASARLQSIEQQKAEAEREDKDNEPLRDAPKRMTLAERTAGKRQQLGPCLDLDAQVARDREQALARPNSQEFIRQLVAETGLSDAAARIYAIALRCVEAHESKPVMVAIADPVTGMCRDRFNVAIQPSGHPMLPGEGAAHYYPSRVSLEAILGLRPGAQLSPQARNEAVKMLELAHLEWETRGLLTWTQRGSWGTLKV
jgi:hypothetical protein